VHGVHNLVRAVAPPYPGANTLAGGLPLRVLRTLPAAGPRSARPELRWSAGEVVAALPDGGLRLLDFELDGVICNAQAFHARFGATALALPDGGPGEG
jgi:methionyl-tRNA formyltransferase